MTPIAAVDRTLAVALYGTFRPHTEHADGATGEEFWALFVDRAVSQGLTEVMSSAGPVGFGRYLTAMCDAGHDWGEDKTDTAGALESRKICWAQVYNQTDSHCLPPVEPLVTCMRDTVGRFGTLRLQAMQAYLHSDEHINGRTDQITMSETFFSDKGDPVPVTMSVELEDACTPEPKPNEIREAINELSIVVRADHAYCGRSPQAMPLDPVLGPHWFAGPMRSVTLEGTMSEWSIDAAGHALFVLTAAFRKVGVAPHKLVTIELRDPHPTCEIGGNFANG